MRGFLEKVPVPVLVSHNLHLCISSCTDDLINGREWAAAARGGEGGG